MHQTAHIFMKEAPNSSHDRGYSLIYTTLRRFRQLMIGQEATPDFSWRHIQSKNWSSQRLHSHVIVPKGPDKHCFVVEARADKGGVVLITSDGPFITRALM